MAAPEPAPSVPRLTDQARVPIVDLRRPLPPTAAAAAAAPSPEAGAKVTREVAAAWGEAMRGAGFAVATGHGIPAELVADLFAASRAFFRGTAGEAKAGYQFGPYGNPRGGYTPRGTEAVARTLAGREGPAASAPPDIVESYVLNGEDGSGGAAWAHHPPALVEKGRPYRAACVELLHYLHRLSALALGLERPDFFDAFHSPPSTSLRLASYPRVDRASLLPGQLRYGAHHDYQGFTILALECPPELAGQPSGLQVFLGSAWVDIPLIPGSLIVNVGELMALWSGGQWQSTLHRVQITDSDCQSDRYSIPFFTGPSDDAIIRPLKEGDPPFEPVRALDHLLRKLASSNT